MRDAGCGMRRGREAGCGKRPAPRGQPLARRVVAESVFPSPESQSLLSSPTMKSGIFVVAELTGEVRERVAEIQRWADPKLANGSPPHITLVGSSGVGPMPADTPVARVRELLEPIVAVSPPITVHFGPPIRFMQTDIIVLPIDPHGPLRILHERIATSGLKFEQPRFSFSPHCTLSFFPTLTPAMQRK